MMITHLATGVTSHTGVVIRTPMTGETAMEATEAQSGTNAGTAKEAVITDLNGAEDEDILRMIEATAEAAEAPKMIESKISDLGGRALRAQADQRVQHYLKHREKKY